MFEITTRPPNTFVFNTNNTSTMSTIGNSPYHHTNHQYQQQQQQQQNVHHNHHHHQAETIDLSQRVNRRNQSTTNSSTNNKQRSSSISIPNSNSVRNNIHSTTITIPSQPTPSSASLAFSYYNRHNLNRTPIINNTSANNRPIVISSTNTTSYFKPSDLNLLTNNELNNANSTKISAKQTPMVSFQNINNETSTVLPVYYQKDSSKLPIVLNRQHKHSSAKSINLNTSVLPTIISNSADSRVGSAHAIVTKQEPHQSLVNKNHSFITRTTSPYVNFYETHSETNSTPTNRLANMYKSNLTNNYNSNSLAYQNESKKHVHFFESPYKFPHKQISVIKGIKVRSDMIFPDSESNVKANSNHRNSISFVDENQKNSSDSDTESYYYTTLNTNNLNVNTVRIERNSPSDTFVKSRVNDELTSSFIEKNENSASSSICASSNGIKKSILTKKKARFPLTTTNMASKSNTQQIQKKVTFAT